VRIGKLDASDLRFAYDAEENRWEGGLAVVLPTPRAITIGGSVVIQDNQFKSIMGEIGNLNQSLGAGVFLQSIRFGVGVDPVTVSGGLSLSAGPTILNQAAIGVDADFRFVFGDPFVLRLDGALSVVSLDLGSAFVEYSSAGYLEFGGRVGQSFGPAFIEGAVDGWIDRDRNFNLHGRIEAGLDLGSPIGRKSIRAEAVVSSVGAAACGDVAGWFAAGVGARWGSTPRLFSGCDLSPYSATRATGAIASMASTRDPVARAALARRASRVGIPPAPMRSSSASPAGRPRRTSSSSAPAGGASSPAPGAPPSAASSSSGARRRSGRPRSSCAVRRRGPGASAPCVARRRSPRSSARSGFPSRSSTPG
jgi:hypothetical protein